MRTVSTRYGFRMRVEVGDWLGRHVYVTGEYEAQTSKVMAALLGPGQVMVDVGANVGYFALLAAHRVGSAGKVFAFEPLPQARAQLVRNVRLNGVGQVTVRAEALCDRAGEAKFYEGPQEHMGISSLRPLNGTTGRLRVPVGQLDCLLPPGQQVNLIKIDVEGAEYLALLGMLGCLQSHRPDLIVEVTDPFLRTLGHSAEMLCDKLRGLGYRMYAIDHDGLLPISGWDATLPDQFNALFTVRAKLPPCLVVKVMPSCLAP
jgi:FkbM family methyltransferase